MQPIPLRAGPDAGVAIRPIEAVAADLGLGPDAVLPWGPGVAKIDPARVRSRAGGLAPLILVTAMTPTPAGEGKTTTAIGLSDALRRLGRRVALCLRQPSLGPTLGLKGGGTGGGRAEVVPAERINLHFTGDIQAVASAHNLLAAMIDNALHWANGRGVDARSITWPRVVDMDDRALRRILIGLGAGNGPPRRSGFDIAAASEVMAILCLAADRADLVRRLGDIVVGRDTRGRPLEARALAAEGAMAALLNDAFLPNLVQTREGTPTLVHGGPFANIAHGACSLASLHLGLRTADLVVTEAGFGADLGAEKFFHIVCPAGGLRPSVAAVVATVRALKLHGGAAQGDLARADGAALARGFANLERHVGSLAGFGVPAVVAINRFAGDADTEVDQVLAACRDAGIPAAACRHREAGGEGALALAELVSRHAGDGARFAPLYAPADPIAEKVRTVARRVYGADDVDFAPDALRAIAALERDGRGHLPVCIAKTPLSFSTDPKKKGAPQGFRIPVREVRLSAGAGFAVVLTGDVVTMPGLPRKPAAERLRLSPAGAIEGLS